MKDLNYRKTTREEAATRACHACLHCAVIIENEFDKSHHCRITREMVEPFAVCDAFEKAGK